VVELPDPDEPDDPDELGLVAPLEAPLLGVLGEVVELLPEPVVLEPVAPLAPDPDLLKWASHSDRDIWPSLFVSTDENVGAMLEPAPLDDVPAEPLAPPAAEPLEPDDIPDEPLEPLEPDAEGVLLLPEDELCAMATPDRAKRAAAVALVTSFNIDHSSLRKG
jgi:hypothetical protein